VKIHPIFALALATVGLLSCVGCQSLTSSTAKGATATPRDDQAELGGPEIELVRHGVLPEFNTTTVGKAFEGTFQNPKWTTFVSPKGVSVVEFDGTVSVKSLDDAKLGYPGDKCLDGQSLWDHMQSPSCMVPVTVQFTLSVDKHTFRIGYISPLVTCVVGRGCGNAAGQDQVMKFIYQ